METGMLWFDNDPKKSLELKIHQAAEYYCNKYGRRPDLCLVNPGNLAKNGTQPDAAEADNVVIRPFRSVLPGHLWIGMEEKSQSTAA